MSGDLLEITEIRRLRIEPGDRLLVRVGRPVVTDADAVLIRERVRAALALPDIPIAITTAEIDITVISGGQGGDQN